MGSCTSAVVFDVGETLIDETRAWERVSRHIGVPAFTFMATFGGLIARGEDPRRVFQVLGTPAAAIEFRSEDFYPDALPCLARLRASGLFVAVAGNTSRSVEALVREFVQPHASFVGSSEGWGIEKPSLAFFERIVAECARPAAEIAYVGDRLDNDIAPALSAGLTAVHLRRGPWSYLHGSDSRAIRIRSLDELPAVLL